MPERRRPTSIETNTPQEKCGLVVLRLPSSSVKDQVSFALLAGGGVQHRGQEKAGLIMKTPNSLIGPHGGDGLISEVFSNGKLDPFLEQTESTWLQLHARYGTDGSGRPENLQPTVSESADGKKWAIIHNGQFTATDKMRESLRNDYPEGISDTYLFAQLLAESEGETNDERVINALKKVNGAYSLAIGVDDDIYLARDEFGIRPFVVGRIQDGYIAASETFGLKKAGVKPEFQIRRGEIVKINDEGLSIIQDGSEDQGFPCIFEYAYFSDPRSRTPAVVDPGGRNPEKWQSIYQIRERSGIIHAEEMREAGELPDDIDYVTGVPDSGVPYAIGLALGTGLPYRQTLLRHHFDPNGSKRLYQVADIDSIAGMVAGKVGPVDDPALFEGMNILMADDSIVRSNVGKQLINILKKDYGANKVYMAAGYSEVLWTCHLGVSMRTQKELVASRFNNDKHKIAEEMGADGVFYISHVGLLQAIGKRKEDIVIPDDPREIFQANEACGGCLTGVYPISKDGVIYKQDIQTAQSRLVFAADN